MTAGIVAGVIRYPNCLKLIVDLPEPCQECFIYVSRDADVLVGDFIQSQHGSAMVSRKDQFHDKAMKMARGY